MLSNQRKFGRSKSHCGQTHSALHCLLHFQFTVYTIKLGYGGFRKSTIIKIDASYPQTDMMMMYILTDYILGQKGDLILVQFLENVLCVIIQYN